MSRLVFGFLKGFQPIAGYSYGVGGVSQTDFGAVFQKRFGAGCCGNWFISGKWHIVYAVWIPRASYNFISYIGEE